MRVDIKHQGLEWFGFDAGFGPGTHGRVVAAFVVDRPAHRLADDE